jgi:hypothetical protein
MYQFILNLWIMKKVDATYVQSKVPSRIMQAECDMILATTQDPSIFDTIKVPK